MMCVCMCVCVCVCVCVGGGDVLLAQPVGPPITTQARMKQGQLLEDIGRLSVERSRLRGQLARALHNLATAHDLLNKRERRVAAQPGITSSCQMSAVPEYVRARLYV